MSKEKFSYKDYIEDKEFTEAYNSYQERYASTLRESEKVIIHMIQERLGGSTEAFRLLDVGCSTGNFLRHVRDAFPKAQLMGGDVAVGVIERCRAQKDLRGITFEELDIFNLPFQQEFDFVAIHAVFYMFHEEEFLRAMASVARCIKPGGSLITYDFFHPYNQSLAILEKSSSHPDGLMLHFRPMKEVEMQMREIGFQEVEFHPFHIPIDLEKDSCYQKEHGGFEDLNSYTIRTDTDERLLFRGALFQPWCHLIGRM